MSNFYVSGSSSLTVTGSSESQTSNSDANQLTVGSVFTAPTAGTSTFVQQGGTVTTNGLSLGGSQNGVTPGIYYLNGGTLTSGTLTRGSNAASSGTLSFGGGTFKNSAAISTDANLTTKISSGGATIDTTSGNLTWSGAILAGNTGTVTGFTGLSGGSGATPGRIPLTFSAPASGTTATGVAIVDQSGVVTDIVITNPGSGYTLAPTITGLPGGASATATFNTTAGGLTKNGSNTLTLTGNNTYTGTTTVNGGTLSLARAGTAGSATGGTLGASTTGIMVNPGGTLLVAASNAVGNTTPMNLGGGMLSLGSAVLQGQGGSPTGATATQSTLAGVGALALSAANSSLAFSGTSGTVVFSSFAPGGFTLNVTGTNFDTTGNGGTDGTNDRLIFTTDLGSAGLADITINNGPVTDVALASGGFEIEAVPEPPTWMAGLASVGVLGLTLLKDRRKARRNARVSA